MTFPLLFSHSLHISNFRTHWRLISVLNLRAKMSKIVFTSSEHIIFEQNIQRQSKGHVHPDRQLAPHRSRITLYEHRNDALRVTWAIALCYGLLTPPGKPSTWFPGEGLVTQVTLCLLLSNMFFKHPLMSQKSYKCHLHAFLKFQNLNLNLLKIWNFA